MLLKYVEKFDRRFIPIFSRALQRNGTALGQILHDNAIVGDTYHCFAADPYLIRKNDCGARQIATGSRSVIDFPLFSNPLAIGEGPDRAVWSLPQDRLCFGSHQIYTFEFDRSGEAFFREQLEWCLPVKDWQKAPLGQLYKRLKTFADFKALTVVWSGNKSLHIHVTFSTQLYHALHGDPTELQRGHNAHWMALLQIVMDTLAPSEGPGPDQCLAWPTSYRRTPMSHRLLEKPNPLGQPEGSLVPQLVLWERAVERNSATTLFHAPHRYVPAVSSRRTCRHERQGRLSIEEIRHCEMRLREHYAGTALQFVGLNFNGQQYRALFRNSDSDQNPSSYMGEEFVVPKLIGRDADSISSIDLTPLNAPMGLKLAEWCMEIAIEDGMTDSQKNDARQLIQANLTRYIVLAKDEPLMLTAAEGISKTTTIINDHQRIDRAINHLGGPAMYAFADYENADEKCAYFNARWRDRGYHGVVWRSWSRSYAEMAAAMGKAVITDDEARAAGISQWKLIEKTQPDVLAEIRREHRSIWEGCGDRKAVLFTVHDVAHRWAQNGRTRRMFDRDFFDHAGSADCRSRSVLSLLVHDEVAPKNLVHILSADQMVWLDELLNRSGDIWSDFRIAEQQKAYDRHVSTVGAVGLDFHQTREAASLKFDEVTLSNSGEYPAFANYDIYDCDDEKAFVAPRNWWREGENQVAERLVLLTTEQVPTAVARKAMPGLVATSPRMLELGRDPITVTVHRGVRSDHADGVTSAFHRLPGWQIIGNKLSADINNAMTHARARGRNDLAEKSIVQTATMFDPAHYRELQALNSWTGQDNLVLLAHADQINQTGGRNRGFRNIGNTEHRLIINRTLYRSMIARPDIMRCLRYAFLIDMGTGQKRKALEKDRSKLGSR